MNMIKLTILWYNVLRGFHRKEKDGLYSLEPDRLKAAKDIIESQNADIVLLGEGDFNPLCKIKGEKIKIIDYQKEFNYPYVYYAEPDAETSRKSEVILSKFEIKCKNYSSPKDKLFTHIKTRVTLANEHILIDMVHPYPTISEKEKANWIGKIIGKNSKRYILLGDFNALSPLDRYNEKELLEAFYNFSGDMKKARRNVEDSLKCLMLKKVISKRLIDTYYNKNKEQAGTQPTKKYLLEGHKQQIRLDYIFCSEDFKILKSGIIKK